ncbi:MAG: tyrosine-type recombinase/integrase [Intrasporangiaceae bacterium]|nr:tyrosine-type recombinase/integrase [Intrasporangiaceae bacterium]
MAAEHVPPQSALDRAWRSAREEAGRPGFRFHNLRHTGLNKYAEQGATLAELLHRGGHTDVTAALRYQHATAQRDRALTELLSREIRVESES